jgi:hypothetical protein
MDGSVLRRSYLLLAHYVKHTILITQARKDILYRAGLSLEKQKCCCVCCYGGGATRRRFGGVMIRYPMELLNLLARVK